MKQISSKSTCYFLCLNGTGSLGLVTLKNKVFSVVESDYDLDMSKLVSPSGHLGRAFLQFVRHAGLRLVA
jgi:hypothetical protein